MKQWCGGSTAEAELAAIVDRTADLTAIGAAEYRQRRQALQDAMSRAGVDSVYLDAGSNLAYFTGVRWGASERLAGAMVPRSGEPTYLVPFFEGPAFAELVAPEAKVDYWHEHESPEDKLSGLVDDVGSLALDPQCPFGRAERIRAAFSANVALQSAGPLIDACRMRKSPAEIALLQRAFDITLRVQAATARILRPGITTSEVARFIDAAHRKAGAPNGSAFCIVLFGPDSAFPHGVKTPKALEAGDTVLIDTGCVLHGYYSDITRTYAFGPPTARQRQVWADERAAQDVAFAAARLGAPCGSVDDAVRILFDRQGYGGDYALPGLPHRTGHGIGLDIHEAPFFVRGDATPLAEGMCLSIEPTLCLPGEFGIRLEDHIFMTAEGPAWFTEPSGSIDQPFPEDA